MNFFKILIILFLSFFTFTNIYADDNGGIVKKASEVVEDLENKTKKIKAVKLIIPLFIYTLFSP